MKINFSALSADERAAEFAKMDNEALAAALAEATTEGSALFALTEPTIEQVNEAEAITASKRLIEDEIASREQAVKDAAERFAAARAQFSSEPVNDGVETGDGDDDGDGDDGEDSDSGDAGDDGEDSDSGDAGEGDSGDGDAGDGDAVTTASAVNHTTSQKVKASAARKVGRKTTRPAVKDADPVIITAAADVPEFSTGQRLSGMEEVTKAVMNRAAGFAPYSQSTARAINEQSGGQPVLTKVGAASFRVPFSADQTATTGNDYHAVKTALKSRFAGEADENGALTAAGWCAPSQPVYSWIADFVVDGLVTVPEVAAPRGGLLLTTGPAHVTQGAAALDGFGFTQTEAQAEAGVVKTCEVIECPEFTDNRLDAIGYCYKIPLLTQAAYPELITDALRLASVLYAHKVNRRVIGDMVTLSDSVVAQGLGATTTDTLEALAIVATRERRKWNVGVNAVMEVKLPQYVREVFRADMSRRQAVAVDAITDAQIDAHFTARRLSVEYVSDWQELPITGNPVFPGTFDALIFPAGTFIKAVKDVINLQAVYDAASLSVNEYTGVFFEQGIGVFKAGYGSTRITIPICTAGLVGAAVLDCDPTSTNVEGDPVAA